MFFRPNLDTPLSKIRLHFSRSKRAHIFMELAFGCPRFAEMQDDASRACLFVVFFHLVGNINTAFFDMRHVRISKQNSHDVAGLTPAFCSLILRHLLARVSLAKRPRPMLQDALHFFRSDLIFPASPVSWRGGKNKVVLKKVQCIMEHRPSLG